MQKAGQSHTDEMRIYVCHWEQKLYYLVIESVWF